ncbi:MATE family efflux transporter [Xanthobacter oligotrophicus]|uniref:MATE family efflux transporter n=1 Tax=Xanthobacter oligotrophicus TaxID=2607286 RepID=UPI0011F2BB36|nr:MATE family efflux transporter [Xanthobacter oligotrophicus]MCG5236450.1 MATE family efflux transporter [Xanthobacter oligotrophicus]
MTLAAADGRVTHRRVLAIALPMTVAHLTTPLLGIVDAAVVGRLGDAALLGGVALAAVIFDMLFWVFGFLRMGTVGLAAQAVGRRDGVEERAVLARALLLAGALGLVLIALQAPIAYAALGLAGASEEVNAAVRAYYAVRIFAAPFTLANYVVLGWLVGLGRTGRALALQVGMNLLNMVLTAGLVLGGGWGVTGAAAGTLMAEIAGTAAGLLLCLRMLGGAVALPRGVLFNRARLAESFLLNRDIMIRTAALMFAFSFFAAQGARAGDVTLAANAVLQNMVMVAAYFLDGFATAAEQICGAAVGGRRRADFSTGVRLCLIWGLVFALVACALYLAIGPAIVDAMTTSEEVRAAARDFLIYAALLPVAGVAAYAFDGVYIGALWSRDMRNLMLCALAVYLAAWWGLRGLGNHGLWLAFLAFLIARGAFQALRLPALERRTFGA